MPRTDAAKKNPTQRNPRSDFILILGNKNYSSWSMRAWLAMRQTGTDFVEEVFHLDSMSSLFELSQKSPTRKVPVLIHEDLAVWDSLAIVEYLAELFPQAGLWPENSQSRAVSRSACAEMHSGFDAVRSQMPMNVRASFSWRGGGKGVAKDIKRVRHLWSELRSRFGSGGPYLFGQWSAADAFYAPMVSRFHTFGVDLDETSQAYVEAVLDWPPVREWFEAARSELWSIAKFDKT